MKTTLTLILTAGLLASTISQAQQNPQPQPQASQAAIASCDDDATKSKTADAAQNEAGRVTSRFFGKTLAKLAPAIARSTHGEVQASDIAQATAESAAQKAREQQEHAKYCAALKVAAKKAAPPQQPATKVVEACPPNTTRAPGTAFCLKPDNTLVDVLHITVPVAPAPSTTTVNPAPPAPAAPAQAK